MIGFFKFFSSSGSSNKKTSLLSSTLLIISTLEDVWKSKISSYFDKMNSLTYDGSFFIVRAASWCHSVGSGFLYSNENCFVFWSLSAKATKNLRIPLVSYAIGRETVTKGSKVIDYFWQSGHTTLDLYCPVIKSVIMDWFLFVWAIQLYLAT